MSSEETSPRTPFKPRGNWLLDGVLLALVVFGVFCRFYNLAWDEYRLLHPDERFLASVVTRVQLPTSWTGYFNSVNSPLNPINLPDVHYVYGELPVLLAKLLLDGVNWFCRFLGINFQITEDGQFLPFGRALSGVFDCLSILASFLVGKKLLGRTGGLVAAAFLALAALHIQQSHFFVVDTFATAFLGFSLLTLLTWCERGKWWWALECGVVLGLALACKLSALLILPAVLLATVVVTKRFGVKPALVGLGVVLLSAFWFFRLGHPMAFAGTGWSGILDLRLDQRFWNDLRTQQVITSGEMDVPFNIQWIGRTSWLYSLGNLWSWGWGAAICLAFVAGAARLCWRPARGKSTQAELGVLLFYALSVFLVQGAAFSKFTRYYLPVTLAAAVIAAYGVVWIGEARPRLKWLQVVPPLGTAVWALAVLSIYTHRHTRLVASDWIRLHIPAGSVLTRETDWDESLPLSWVPWPEARPGQDNFLQLNLNAFETDSQAKGVDIIQKLDMAQFVILSSNRAWATAPRWPDRYPIMKRFYQTLFDGSLGFRLRKEFTSYPRLGPWSFPDGQVEEALTVYDHPRVLIFEKTAAWDAKKAAALLLSGPVPVGRSQWHPRSADPSRVVNLPRPGG